MTQNNKAMSADNDQAWDDAELLTVGEMLSWLVDAKWVVAAFAAVCFVAAMAAALLLPQSFTARTTLLPPGSQQQSGSAAALGALGALGVLPGGLGAKTPDELYVSLLRSDSVLRALDVRFKLQERYSVKSFEQLRKAAPVYITIGSDKKTGVITLMVEDKDPAFAADLANAHLGEVSKVLDRLAVTEAQQRRVFFEGQLQKTKDNLVKAEQDLRVVQEKSGVIVLDKQAEALIGSAAQLRAVIAEREVQLKVLKTGATEQNPEVIRLNSELAALRGELTRLESSKRPANGGGNGSGNGGANGAEVSALDMAVNRLPEAGIAYIRARRELKLQETLLENILRQYELAKLDEAKEGQVLQQIDKAVPPDYRSFPPRMILVAGGTLAGLLLGAAWVIVRRLRSQGEDGAVLPGTLAAGRR